MCAVAGRLSVADGDFCVSPESEARRQLACWGGFPMVVSKVDCANCVNLVPSNLPSVSDIFRHDLGVTPHSLWVCDTFFTAFIATQYFVLGQESHFLQFCHQRL